MTWGVLPNGDLVQLPAAPQLLLGGGGGGGGLMVPCQLPPALPSASHASVATPVGAAFHHHHLHATREFSLVDSSGSPTLASAPPLPPLPPLPLPLPAQGLEAGPPPTGLSFGEEIEGGEDDLDWSFLLEQLA